MNKAKTKEDLSNKEEKLTGEKRVKHNDEFKRPSKWKEAKWVVGLKLSNNENRIKEKQYILISIQVRRSSIPTQISFIAKRIETTDISIRFLFERGSAIYSIRGSKLAEEIGEAWGSWFRLPWRICSESRIVGGVSITKRGAFLILGQVSEERFRERKEGRDEGGDWESRY